MFPTTACVDVPRPTYPTFTPVRVIGHDAVMLFCLPESVDAKSVPASESVPK